MECVESCGIEVCRQWTKDVLDPKSADENKDYQKLAYDVEMLMGILQNAVDNGELTKDTPVEDLTHIIICELYGMMTCWCMSDGKFEPLEWTERFCRVQLNALIKQYICN